MSNSAFTQAANGWTPTLPARDAAMGHEGMLPEWLRMG